MGDLGEPLASEFGQEFDEFGSADIGLVEAGQDPPLRSNGQNGSGSEDAEIGHEVCVFLNVDFQAYESLGGTERSFVRSGMVLPGGLGESSSPIRQWPTMVIRAPAGVAKRKRRPLVIAR